jgi:hypothetical protein
VDCSRSRRNGGIFSNVGVGEKVNIIMTVVAVKLVDYRIVIY